MNILITLQEGDTRNIYFPEAAMQEIYKLGNVRLNETGKAFSGEALAEQIKGVDICITHWGCPKFTEKVLENADSLKMVAHAAGSIANHITDAVYEKGIKVSSSNDIMAKYVAEGTLAFMLSALRLIPRHVNDMKNKLLWNQDIVGSKSLFGKKIGLVGLGTVGRYLLDLLMPFNVAIKIYDPYLNPKYIEKYSNVGLGSLEEVLSWGEIISLHASLTPETRGLINTDRLKLIKDGSLLINTARGHIIDQKALEAELGSGRINAVLDVYEEEPLPLNSPLRDMDNVLLMPHMAAAASREEMTFAMIDEVKRYLSGEALKYEIPYAKFKLMTQER